jgi:hypothetical protein
VLGFAGGLEAQLPFGKEAVATAVLFVVWSGGSGLSGGPRSQSQILEGTLQRRDPSRGTGTGTVRVDAAVGPLAASSRHRVGCNSPSPSPGKALQQAKPRMHRPGK